MAPGQAPVRQMLAFIHVRFVIARVDPLPIFYMILSFALLQKLPLFDIAYVSFILNYEKVQSVFPMGQAVLHLEGRKRLNEKKTYIHCAPPAIDCACDLRSHRLRKQGTYRARRTELCQGSAGPDVYRRL